MEQDKRQREHYDTISYDYAQHYSDSWALRYRDLFIHRYMFSDIDFNGKTILDAMCGPGQITGYLLKRWPNADITALDISQKVLNIYMNSYQSCKTNCAPFLENGFRSYSFDAIFIFGGLHHIQPNVEDAVIEVHRLLKPGGIFSFCEPHSGGCLEVIRRYWYKKDRFFEKNEASIDIRGLKKRFTDKFEFIGEHYLGSIAYFLVFNSLVFRLPLSLKRVYSPALLAIEWLLKPFQNHFFSAFVVCQWRKPTGVSSEELDS
jgi:SAM-dependent methyltransferase